MIRVVVLASGEGTNLQALLDAAREGRLGGRVVAVLSDRPGARALERAAAAGVPAEPIDPRAFADRTAFDRALLSRLRAHGPDLVVLAGFMRILGPEVVAAFRHRVLNVHPTLLPAFPGLHAHRQALAHGVKVSGCTIHFVDEGVDSGPIVLQAAVPVAADDDEESLAERIKRVEHRLYPLAVRLFAEGRLAVEGRRVRVELRPGELEEALAGLPPGTVVAGPWMAAPARGQASPPGTAAAAGASGPAGAAAARRRRALLSVHDKRGLVDLARALADAGWELVASGGTAAALAAAGVPVIPTERLTGFGSLLGGRVKTLHPAVHAGILARDDPGDRAELVAAGIEPFDLVVCNLYPFEEAAAAGARGAALLEQIDVGGPAMVRAAAKNWPRVTVLVDPGDYPRVLPHLVGGGVPAALRRRLAVKAFRHTACYDAVVAEALAAGWADEALGDAGGMPDGEPGGEYDGEAAGTAPWPERLALPLVLRSPLRYGENPHQRGALYVSPLRAPGLAGARQLQGKELSYTNLLDADAAWRCARQFGEPAAVAVKHATPCGAAVAATLAEAFRAARDADPVSIFGGIVAFNRPVDADAAAAAAEVHLDVIVAPDFAAEALAILGRRRNLRLLAVPGGGPDGAGVAPGAGSAALPAWELRAVDGGWLVHEPDAGAPGDDPATWRPVTRRVPTPEQLRDLAFAWHVARYVRSNAIVVASGGRTLGIGGGQTSRVAAAEQALARAGAAARGAVLASDAFIPFPDTVELAARAGIAAIVQPGGSVRDGEVIAAADAAGIAMVFTGVRHFRH